MVTYTYGNMQDRIADELLRTDLTSQIKLAILSAIDYYQDERFWFNESRSQVTFSLSSSQEFYGTSDNANIPNLLDIDTVTVTVNSNRYTLTRRTYEYLESISMGTQYTSLPTDYSYYQQQIRIYPIPNQGMAIRISSTVLNSTTLSSTADTNPWVNEAEQMIRARAKADIYLNVIGDAAQAQAMNVFEQQSYQNLIEATQRRLSTGKTKASYF